jgi:glutamate-1-semialdehyde 2,1-aminomutase
LLVRAGSGVETLGLPDSPGVPPGYARETLIAKYNDIASVQRIMNSHGRDVAAIIIEPICGNMGVIPPDWNVLKSLRQITRRSGALLIFDEVITGFRVARGGAQEIFQVKPDLTCLGKILGGGFPLAAFGGARRIMKLLAPSGAVYQAGTLSGNPMAVSAGITTLELLRRRGIYKSLDEKARYLERGFKNVLKKHGIEAALNRVGSMMTVFFGVDEVRNADDARQCDRVRFADYFHGMLRRGIYLPPSPFEAMFISTAHSTADLDATIRAFDRWAANAA